MIKNKRDKSFPDPFLGLMLRFFLFLGGVGAVHDGRLPEKCLKSGLSPTFE